MKKKPAFQERASLLNALNEKRGASFTVLSSKTAELSKEPTKGFGCNHCSTHFSALAAITPFCVNCGSEDVAEDNTEVENEEFQDDNELSAVQCAACGTHSIISDVTASTLNGKMNCVTCGSEIDFVPPTVDEEESNKACAEPMADADADSDTEEMFEEESADDTQDNVDGVDNDADVKLEEDSDAATELMDEKTMEDNMDEEDAGDTSYMDADMVSSDLLKVMSAKKDVSFGLMTVNDRIIATLDDVPVADLDKADSGDNEEVFSSKAFAQAIAHAVKGQGVEKALAHYNFKSIVVAFPLKKEVEARVEKALAAKSTEVQAKLGDLSADFAQCVALAASGLNKGFFKGKDHPLKAAFFSELEAAGVRKPTAIIDKVFASVGGQYNKVLIALATDLMSKSLDLRNELAAAIDDTTYQAVADVEDDTEKAMDDDNAPLEDRLESASLRSKREVASVTDVKTLRKSGMLFNHANRA